MRGKRLRGIPGSLCVLALGAVGVRALVGWSLWGSSSNQATPQGGVQITEHVFQEAASPSANVGEDCTVNGSSDCIPPAGSAGPGVCFHYKPDPTTGYVCSMHCERTEDCPDGWACFSVYPAPGETYCSPPADWAPQAASLPAPSAQ